MLTCESRLSIHRSACRKVSSVSFVWICDAGVLDVQEKLAHLPSGDSGTRFVMVARNCHQWAGASFNRLFSSTRRAWN